MLMILARNLAALSIAIFIIYYALGPQLALIALSIGFASASVVSVYELRLRRKLDYTSELNETLFALHLVYMDLGYGGKSLTASMESAVSGMRDRSNKRVRMTFEEIRKRLQTGQDLGQAVQSTCNKRTDAASAALCAIGKEYQKGSDALSSVKGTYDRILKEQELKKECTYGSLQKYLTMCMALGTVLPSFAVFAFVGYSMVYYSAYVPFLLFMLMLIFLPDFYALLRIHIAGVYAQ